MALQKNEESALTQTNDVVAPAPRKRCIIIAATSVVFALVVAVSVTAYFLLSKTEPLSRNNKGQQLWGWGGWGRGGSSLRPASNSGSTSGSTSGCSDAPPPTSQYSCAQQQQFGKCGKDWMKGYCCNTCGGCDCGGGGGGGSGTSFLDATTLQWNSHRPCATENPQCVALARQRLGAMAMQVNAKIVGAVELDGAPSALPNWQTSHQQCDHSAIMVAPGWRITNSGGHCMGNDPNKGFAVALVTPPQPVRQCPSLCVFMGHVPHPGARIDGHSEIASVCGGAQNHCMVAMADWNTPDVRSPWSKLIGGAPSLVEPSTSTKTCCYPKFDYSFDHVATNIAGATSAGDQVFGPQLTQFPSGDEHKPTSVQLRLPVA